MRKIMASLDIGSDSIKLVVGELVKNRVSILAVAEEPSYGVKDALVVNPDELIKPLERVINKCEEIIGLPIHQLVLTIPSKGAEFSVVTGSVKINNEGSVITGDDVLKVLKVACKDQVPEDKELISIMPTSFSLDDNRVVRDPKGLTSLNLSVRGVLITEPKDNLYKILSCLEKLNIDVLDISVGAIGDYYEFKTKEDNKNVGIIVNLGAETSTISVFNKGVLTNTQVIDLGGKNIDNDISFIYKIPISVSHELKHDFALAHNKEANKEDIRVVKNKSNEDVRINQYEISEVVKCRLEEILKIIQKQINILTKKEISYIIFTGGLTEIRDFKLILEEVFGEGAIRGRMSEIGVRHNKYSSCVGMIKYFAEKAKLKDKDFSIFSIEEQQVLSGTNSESGKESTIGKLFGYFFSN